MVHRSLPCLSAYPGLCVSRGDVQPSGLEEVKVQNSKYIVYFQLAKMSMAENLQSNIRPSILGLIYVYRCLIDI